MLMAPNLNRPPTIILIQGARAPSIYFLPTNLNGPPTIIFKWAPYNSIDSGDPGPFNLIFANQFKSAPYNHIKMVTNLNAPPSNNIDPGGPGFFNLMFANQFKWAHYNNVVSGGPGPLN